MHAFESEDRLMVVSGVCLHMFILIDEKYGG